MKMGISSQSLQARDAFEIDKGMRQRVQRTDADPYRGW